MLQNCNRRQYYLEQVYEERLEKAYGFYRPYLRSAVLTVILKWYI